MTVYHCVYCHKRIPAERVKRALARGKQPKYDKDDCTRKYHNEQTYKRRKAEKPTGWPTLASLPRPQ
jgi:hypothetical protein